MPGGSDHQTTRTPELMLSTQLAAIETCWLEARCGTCRAVTMLPSKLLVLRHGGETALGTIVDRLRCQRCRIPPARVWLNETHTRGTTISGPGGWSVQLVGEVEPG